MGRPGRIGPLAHRTGQHNERGEIRLGPSVELIQWHLIHHLYFVRRKRELLKTV